VDEGTEEVSYWVGWTTVGILCATGSAILSSFLVAYWVRWFERRDTKRLQRELEANDAPRDESEHF